ncbi:hypothetical protein AAC387_Pa06g0832 [Persea americana]
MAPGLSAISQTSFSLAAILQNHQNTPPKIPNNGFFRTKTSSKNPSPSPSHSNTTHVSRAPALLEPAIYQTNNDPNSKICRFCDLGDLSSAMNLLSETSLRKFQLDSKTYCSILQLCADHKSLSDGRKVHTILTSSGVEIDPVLGAKLVFMYVKCGDLREGRLVFDKIEKENVFVWNLVMNEHMGIGEFTESISLYKQMRESGVELNSYTFSCVLKCFAVLGGVRDGERVHGHLLRLGYGSYNTVGNALIAFYAKCKKIESAYALFDEMLERDVISWNSMISGFVSNGLAERGVGIFSEMWFSGIRMDLITMVSVLPACAEMGFHRQARVLHGYAIKSGYAEEITFCNSLLDMYAKCRKLSNAVQVFERMSKRSVVSWTSMISGYTRDGKFDKAIELFEEMEVEGIKPDLFTVTSILHACACNGSIEQGKGIHDYVMRNGLQSNLSVANALMDMYAKCGSMEDARLIFDHMFARDIISWNTMIGGYSKNSLPNEALDLFVKMQLESKPNGVTMACILPACASLSALEKGREIHGHILRNGFLSDGYIANALVDMYVKCGALALARLLFDRMTMKDLVSWTVMIAGYGMHGHGKYAISAFNQMQDMGIKPDEVSFVAILYACSHSGLVDEGWRFFTTMRDDCKIEPKLEHYACMVDLLSRAGHLRRAYKFIESMPIEPDSTVWGALLCGCRTHRDVKLAEKVAEHVFELEPANTGYYILLANIYAEAEMWEAVKKIRERIGSRKLRKNPGCSWIEIKSRVNVFVAGDRSHPQSGKLQSFLETVRIRMKEEGYIPKKRYALLNGDDEEKEEALCGHSEKLAIAFGILNSPPGRSIRVTKNLRVCGDCHEVAKFMSKMVETEIVLRDSNRFHLFENGRCSCRGYW